MLLFLSFNHKTTYSTIGRIIYFPKRKYWNIDNLLSPKRKKKVTSVDKNVKETTKTISDRLKFADSAWLMAGLLSNLVGNFVEGIQKTKCKYGDDSKTCEKCGVKYKVDLIEYKFLCRNMKYQKHFDEDLKNICQYIQIFWIWYQQVCFVLPKRCLPIWICMTEKNLIEHHYLGRRPLQSLKNDFYFLCILNTRKKSL